MDSSFEDNGFTFFKIKSWLVNSIDSLLLFLSALFFGLGVYEIGFSNLQLDKPKLHWYFFGFILFYFVYYYLKNFRSNFINNKGLFLSKTLFLVWLFYYILNVSMPLNPFVVSSNIGEYVNSFYLIYLLLGIVFFAEFSKKINWFYRIKLNFALIIIVSFGLIILLGTFALMMPNATTSGISFIDALFTSTSAVCVTGLSCVDTATFFTALGKTLILLLIQVGGLGIMTFTTVFVFFFKTGNSLREQILLKDAFSADNPADVFKVAIKILVATVIIEGIGAAIIFFSLDDIHFAGFGNKFEFSVFHAVSAFCNAGFSTLSNNLNEPYLHFNYSLFWVISFLIIIGGIGFPLIINTYNYFKIRILTRFSKFLWNKEIPIQPRLININSRIAMIMTLILLVFGTLCYFVFEYNNTLVMHTTWYGKLAVSFFNSVTPRTAGFNNVDMTTLGKPIILVMIFLMWVGASPASTGGGIKTTTFTIAILNIFSVSRGLGRIEMYKRKIRNNSERRTLAVIFLSLIAIGLGSFLILLKHPEMSLLKIVFECFSAYGTVGLSLGITAGLSDFGKSVLVALMFLGRVGALNFFIGIMKNVKVERYQYPKENILIN